MLSAMALMIAVLGARVASNGSSRPARPSTDVCFVTAGLRDRRDEHDECHRGPRPVFVRLLQLRGGGATPDSRGGYGSRGRGGGINIGTAALRGVGGARARQQDSPRGRGDYRGTVGTQQTGDRNSFRTNLNQPPQTRILTPPDSTVQGAADAYGAATGAPSVAMQHQVPPRQPRLAAPGLRWSGASAGAPGEAGGVGEMARAYPGGHGAVPTLPPYSATPSQAHAPTRARTPVPQALVHSHGPLHSTRAASQPPQFSKFSGSHAVAPGGDRRHALGIYLSMREHVFMHVCMCVCLCVCLCLCVCVSVARAGSLSLSLAILVYAHTCLQEIATSRPTQHHPPWPPRRRTFHRHWSPGQSCPSSARASSGALILRTAWLTRLQYPATFRDLGGAGGTHDSRRNGQSRARLVAPRAASVCSVPAEPSDALDSGTTCKREPLGLAEARTHSRARANAGTKGGWLELTGARLRWS